MVHELVVCFKLNIIVTRHVTQINHKLVTLNSFSFTFDLLPLPTRCSGAHSFALGEFCIPKGCRTTEARRPLLAGEFPPPDLIDGEFGLPST